MIIMIIIMIIKVNMITLEESQCALWKTSFASPESRMNPITAIWGASWWWSWWPWWSWWLSSPALLSEDHWPHWPRWPWWPWWYWLSGKFPPWQMILMMNKLLSEGHRDYHEICKYNGSVMCICICTNIWESWETDLIFHLRPLPADETVKKCWWSIISKNHNLEIQVLKMWKNQCYDSGCKKRWHSSGETSHPRLRLAKSAKFLSQMQISKNLSSTETKLCFAKFQFQPFH